MSFTTVDDAALSINENLASLTALQLAQLTALVAQVDGIINNYCGWNLLATDYVDKRFSGSGTSKLDLRMQPINSLTTVKVRETDGSFTDVTTGVEILDSGELQFLPYATTDTTVFTAGYQNWFLTFNAGYLPGSIPTDLVWAANYLVTLHYGKTVNQSVGLLSNKNTDIDVTFESVELPRLVTRTLDRYRLVSVF